MKKVAYPPIAHPEVNTQRVAVIVFVIVALLMSAYLAADRLWLWLGTDTTQSTPADDSLGLVLPNGWEVQPTDSTNQHLIWQASKVDTDTTVIPAVTVLYTTKSSDVDPEEYTQQLVEAAESGLTNLHYDENTYTLQNGLAVRRLQGSYAQGSDVVGVKQQMYVQGDDVYTFTGVFEPDSPESTEVELVFDQVLGKVLGL